MLSPSIDEQIEGRLQRDVMQALSLASCAIRSTRCPWDARFALPFQRPAVRCGGYSRDDAGFAGDYPPPGMAAT